MTQILITLKDRELSTILRTKLSKEFGLEVIVKSSAHDAISLLQILPEIDIILCSDVIDKVQAATKISEYLVSASTEEVQLIVFGETLPVYKKSVLVPENIPHQKIIDYISFLLGKTEFNVLVEEDKIQKMNEEKERIEREKREQEERELRALQRIEEELQNKKAMIEKAEKKRALEERIARGLARAAKLEQEKAEKERREREEEEKKRQAKLQAEAELAEKAERERQQKAKAELERQEKERLLQETFKREKLEREAKEQEKLSIIDQERKAREEFERKEKEFLLKERERREKEKLEREIALKEKAALEKVAALEKAALEKAAALERAALEKAAAIERAALEKAAQELAALSAAESNEKTTVFKLPANFKTPAAVVDKVVEQEKIQEFFNINTIYFLSLTEVVLDFSVYTRIKKGSGFEYNVKISSNTRITRSDIERILIRSGNLYVTQEEYSKANSYLCSNFLKRFSEQNLNLIERIKLNSESYEILMDLFKSLAFDKYNVEIIKQLIKSIDLTVKNPKMVEATLAALKTHKLSYGYLHAQFALYFLFGIVDFFEWGKDQSKNKLLYLSLFHDLCLHNDRLIKLHHNYFHEVKELNDDEKQTMAGHADAAATALETIVKAPKELTALIREHHGLKSGKGFIEGLSIAISPTSMAFIVIEDFTTNYLSVLEKPETDKLNGINAQQFAEIFKTLKTKYDRANYKDVVDQLEKFIKSN